MDAQPDVAIRVRDLSKCYRIYRRPADLFIEALTGRARHREFWSLRGVSFDVGWGEIFGVVGRNGAGKSTLLKIVSGTLDHTSGDVTVNGKVAAILELGSGFHPEFSGRENIYLGGMCLGLSREQVEERIDEIIDFSELRPFIDQPFKTYSSGMQSRLTFATATSIDPDILIIDEALSVGDARFQRKSFTRIERFRKRGKTILLVSHDVNTIATFCDRAVFLENGEVRDIGAPKRVILEYHRVIFSETGAEVASLSAPEPAADLPEPAPASIPATTEPAVAPPISRGPAPIAASERIGNGAMVITWVGIVDAEGRETTILNARERYSFVIRARCEVAIETLVPGFLIRTPKGVDIFGWDNAWAGLPVDLRGAPGEVVEARLEVSMWLANGDYFLTVAVADGNSEKYDLHYDAVHFKVVGTEALYSTSLVNLDPGYCCTRVPSAKLIPA